MTPTPSHELLELLLALTLSAGTLGSATQLLWWRLSPRRDWVFAKRLRQTLARWGFSEQTTKIGQSVSATGGLDRFEAVVDLDLAQDGRTVLRVVIALGGATSDELQLAAKWPNAPQSTHSRGLGDAQFDRWFDCLAGVSAALAELTPPLREALCALWSCQRSLSAEPTLALEQGKLIMELGWQSSQWPQHEEAIDGLFTTLRESLERFTVSAASRGEKLLAQLNTAQPLEWRAQALRHLLQSCAAQDKAAQDEALLMVLTCAQEHESAYKLKELCYTYALNRLAWGRWPGHDRAQWAQVIQDAAIRLNDLEVLATLAGFMLAQGGPAHILGLQLQSIPGRRLLRGALLHPSWRQVMAKACADRILSLPWPLQRLLLQEMNAAGVRLELEVLRLLLARTRSVCGSWEAEEHLGELFEALLLWPASWVEEDMIGALSYPSSRQQARGAGWLAEHGSARSLSALQALAVRSDHLRVARAAHDAILLICKRLGMDVQGALSLSYPDDIKGQLSFARGAGELSVLDSGEFVAPGYHRTGEFELAQLKAPSQD